MKNLFYPTPLIQNQEDLYGKKAKKELLIVSGCVILQTKKIN